MSSAALLGILLAFRAAGWPSGTPEVREVPQPPARPALSVLFVGNSLTYVNDVPGLTRSLAASSAPRAGLTVLAVTGGGATLSEHWRRGEAARVLRARRPDVLVLQAQSTEALTAPAELSRCARLLKAEADSVGARTVLFQTWARPPGDGFYAWSGSGGSPAAMQALLNQAYDSLARDLHVEVARVGEAFALVRRRSPDIALLDGTQHATLAGSYLAAAVLFRSLSGCSPVGATFAAGLPSGVASTLQQAAADVAPAATGPPPPAPQSGPPAPRGP